MSTEWPTRGSGAGQRSWPVLVLLLVAVLVPTACVLWFMAQAMRNERLVVRQKLVEAYRVHLSAARDEVETYWQGKLRALGDVEPQSTPAERFARLVRGSVADSVVLYDEAGQIIYPVDGRPRGPIRQAQPKRWLRAWELEHVMGNAAGAAAVYGEIADRHAGTAPAAQAIRARARCLARLDRTDEAIELLSGLLASQSYRNARDADGHVIVLDAQMMMLELMGDAAHPAYGQTLAGLAHRVADFSDVAAPIGQRRFLMSRLRQIAPNGPRFPTLEAHDLAERYLAVTPLPPLLPGPVRTMIGGVWQLPSADRRVVALLTESRIVDELGSRIGSQFGLTGAHVVVLPPGSEADARDAFVTVRAGGRLPDWQLALYLDGPDPFAAAASRQITVYLWTAIVVVTMIALLAALVARYVGRQMRLTRLKNDLIATVSHELKTPLSAMRILVDTLVEGRYHDSGQVREYLGLIARENARLSRLIDNFLTFSRMERDRLAFDMSDVAPADVATAAVDAVQERFASPGCRLNVEVSPDLPTITGDRDALVTMLVNLLDNAWKYTGQTKDVHLRALAVDGHVRFEVTDNGVGLPRRAIKRVFDRFYQVDRSLSRTAGGCGLGLSIVRFIVTAHGGSIEVTSQPGEGSTFAVTLPSASRA
ncbi:MAG TPA: HAMP domain-containing sensor histidine kinase [Phycisphaerae bacterium]|nr:HAMP domain-containing sensor histidine kinase [Phycisphaerae bacterium]